MPKRNHIELRIQMACVLWFAYEFPKQRGCLFMVNNENRNGQEAVRNKKMGLVPGVSDLIYLSPSGQFHAIELKTDKGRQRDTQKEWQQAIEQHNGHYHIIRSAPEFMELIKSLNK